MNKFLQLLGIVILLNITYHIFGFEIMVISSFIYLIWKI